MSVEELVEVRLVGVPLREYRLAQQHHDELVREFELIAIDAEAGSVPRRLLALVQEFQERYAPYTAAARRDIFEAAERGQEAVDVRVRVPPGVGDASRRLLELLEEADEFCRQGELLTLAAPPEAAAFRRWYLGQFVDQTR